MMLDVRLRPTRLVENNRLWQSRSGEERESDQRGGAELIAEPKTILLQDRLLDISVKLLEMV